LAAHSRSTPKTRADIGLTTIGLHEKVVGRV